MAVLTRPELLEDIMVRHEMKHDRKAVCDAVLDNDKSVIPPRASVHTGISCIQDGLIWYAFINTHQVFWATLDQNGGLWISEDEL